MQGGFLICYLFNFNFLNCFLSGRSLYGNLYFTLFNGFYISVSIYRSNCRITAVKADRIGRFCFYKGNSQFLRLFPFHCRRSFYFYFLRFHFFFRNNYGDRCLFTGRSLYGDLSRSFLLRSDHSGCRNDSHFLFIRLIRKSIGTCQRIFLCFYRKCLTFCHIYFLYI